MANFFFEIGLIIIVATVIGYIANLLKQPLIPSYILSGLLIGPILGLVTNSEVIFLLSEIGIAFMLFFVGMEIDFDRLKNVALISTLGGASQSVILFILGYIIATAMGFLTIEAAYIGLILAFGSTMVVLKLLSDNKELETLHGRIVIGMLLMEDIIAIFALTILTTVNQFSFNMLLLSLAKGVGILLAAALLGKYVFPKIFKIAAKSQEILFLTSLTVCFLFAIVFNLIGFSIAIGGFIAGVTLANLEYNIEIISRVRPLKDFFATIFFVSLGLQILVSKVNSFLPIILAAIGIVIIIKPLLRMTTTSMFGYKKRPAFLTSICLAQTSEFSLIIVAQGLQLGHIGADIFSMAIIVAVVTITVTSYLSNYSEKLLKWLRKPLSLFEKLNLTDTHLEYAPKHKKHEVILCGYNRIGYGIIETLKKSKKKIFVIDYNPEVIRKLVEDKIPCIYGDASDLEIVETMNLKHAKMIISTIPNLETNYLLIKRVREVNKKALLMVTAEQVEQALKLYDKGADYVIMPHLLGGSHVSVLIKNFDKSFERILKTKPKHIEELRHRKKLGHDKLVTMG